MVRGVVRGTERRSEYAIMNLGGVEKDWQDGGQLVIT